MGAGIVLGLGKWDLSLGLGFTNEKTIEKWEWDLDLNKIIEMGMGFAQNPDWKMG